MKRSYKIIPIYTADVSGVCSALYELGGMTVMHDPSGCNSTYNTHDEIRWYDQDSMIYISGLTEIDAVMGNDEKLICDIEIAAEELKPKFIALAGSPIPYMNGTDFEAIAKILEQDLGIPAFSVPTNGTHRRKERSDAKERESSWCDTARFRTTGACGCIDTECGTGGMEGVVDLGDGRYTGKPCSCTGGRGESGGVFYRTPGSGNIAGKIRDALCDRYTDSGIYENSVECNGREKACSISGRREADQRIYAGIRKERYNHIDRGTCDHEIAGCSN